MSFPSSGVMAMYRNPVEVRKPFESVAICIPIGFFCQNGFYWLTLVCSFKKIRNHISDKTSVAILDFRMATIIVMCFIHLDLIG